MQQKPNKVWKFHFAQNFVNWCKLYLLGLTRGFGIENSRLVCTGTSCPNLQARSKFKPQ